MVRTRPAQNCDAVYNRTRIENDLMDSGGMEQSFRHSDRRFMVAAVLFWTVFGCTVTANLMLSNNTEQVSTSGILAFSFGASVLWLILTPPYVRLVHLILTRKPGGGRILVLILLAIAAGIFVAAAVSGLSRALLYLFYERGFLVRDFGLLVQYRLPLDLMASFVVLLAGIARNYLHNLQMRQREAAVLRTQLAESRLAVLRTQLNPHFLFNTLHAVGAVAQYDPKRVPLILSQLSDLLRYILDETGEEEVPLEDELDILARYFDILELRYEGWLQTSISSAPEIRRALVPNLILQPLAENALMHGVGPAGGMGWIKANALREGDSLVLRISDSGPGKAKAPLQAPRGTPRIGGFGVRHTRERLEELYGKDHSFLLAPSPEGGMVAEIRIPYHTDPIPTFAHVQIYSDLKGHV